MISPDNDLPPECEWDITTERPFLPALDLDLTPASLRLETDYQNCIEVLGQLNPGGNVPSYGCVEAAISSLSPGINNFLNEHCKSLTLILVPSARDTQGAFGVGIVAELGLEFEQRSIGQVYSIIAELLAEHGLRFLHAHEWQVAHEMRKLLKIEAPPGGTYFPLFSYRKNLRELIPVASVIGEVQRFLMFPGNRIVPSNMVCYVAAMVDVTL